MTSIETVQDLSEAVFHLCSHYETIYRRSLEEYLRALLAVIHEQEQQSPSYEYLVELLRRAFETEPVSFDARWLQYDRPPEARSDSVWNSGNGQINTAVTEEVHVDASGFQYLMETLLFQIADLYRMRENLPDFSFQISSPTGNTWYNVNVFDFLECGIAGFTDHIRASRTGLPTCKWARLADILELGRVYE